MPVAIKFYCRPSKFTCFLALVSLAVGSTAGAVVCIPTAVSDPNNGGNYFSAIVSSIEEAQMGFDSEEQGKRAIVANGADGLSSFIFSYKTANLNYECAASNLAGYKTSSNEMISSSAKAIEQAFQVISAGNISFIETVKSTANGTQVKNQGATAEANADQRIKVKGAWETFLVSTMAATFEVLGPARKDGKKQDRLTLTSKQRSSLISRLKKIREKKPVKGDIGAPVAAAQQLKTFLLDKWRSSDEK